MTQPDWLTWAKRLNAIAQAGLTFSKDKFDIERFEQVREVAAEMVQHGTGQPIDEIAGLLSAENGYPCPKTGVRAAVIRYVEDKPEILLVQELAENGAWTMPGGFADVGDTPSDAVERETFEETGYRVKAVKLLGIANRNRFAHAQSHWNDLWYTVIQCELVGGSPKTSIETGECRFFPLDALPETMSNRRTPPEVIAWVRAAVLDGAEQASFN